VTCVGNLGSKILPSKRFGTMKTKLFVHLNRTDPE